jgi:hypothetical protein
MNDQTYNSIAQTCFEKGFPFMKNVIKGLLYVEKQFYYGDNHVSEDSLVWVFYFLEN